jgi:hypothetical protein
MAHPFHGRNSAACPGRGAARTARRARGPQCPVARPAQGSQPVSCSAGQNCGRDSKWSVAMASGPHHSSGRYRPPLHDTDCERSRWWWLTTIAPHLHPTAGGPLGHPPFGAFFSPLFAVVRSPPEVVVAVAVTVLPPPWSMRRRLLDRDEAGATLLPSQMRRSPAPNWSPWWRGGDWRTRLRLF